MFNSSYLRFAYVYMSRTNILDIPLPYHIQFEVLHFPTEVKQENLNGFIKKKKNL